MSGIDTYFTDLGHGGEMNPFLHMLGHALAGLFSTLIGWGLGALVLLIAGAVRKAKSGSTQSVARWRPESETGMRVLDLACGSGGQSIKVARRVGPKGKVVASDISTTMLEYVRQIVEAAA